MGTAGAARPGTPGDPRTLRWWTLLRGIAVFNVLAWVATFLSVDDTLGSVRIHLVLSALYVAVCAFRSFLPRIDLERTVLVDHWASSMVAGRGAATVAEICFALQVALLVRQVGDAAGLSVLVGPLPLAIVAALTVAQGFCWLGVVTLSHLGHAIEESLWAATFTAVGVALAVGLPHLDGPLRAPPSSPCPGASATSPSWLWWTCPCTCGGGGRTGLRAVPRWDSSRASETPCTAGSRPAAGRSGGPRSPGSRATSASRSGRALGSSTWPSTDLRRADDRVQTEGGIGWPPARS